MDWDDLFGYKNKSSHRSSSSLITENRENEAKPSEGREMRGNMKNEDHDNVENAGEAIERPKPRVRLPIVTKGIINPVAIAQLQDELEDTKKELDRLRATRVPSKDEIILPKKMTLPKLMEMCPAVGDQILAKMDQKLSDARKEYEDKVKQLTDQHRDNFSRGSADSREMASKIYNAERKLRELGEIAKTRPNAPVGEVWTRIQDGTYDRSKGQVDEPKDFYKSEPSPEWHNSRLTTPDLMSSGNPFRYNRWANSDDRKREHDDPAQPEFGKDVKRLRTA
ncbi:hypothetical protein SBOR_7538 [Sclerotinia borealis F-4128]|uniref:Uncharacterized protein n=1 Tax=Sclerotinia borealis (strain F-4128) TaxID=1432307 RepID=W9C8A2_SCLBF|nr:hypothetical protein SBOR_7538 [Sclerotinia borealis F-4128]